MSTIRRHRAYSKKQLMGKNGRLACLHCDSDIVDRKRYTFCTKKCSDEFRILTSPSYARLVVFRRDNGICAGCRRDTLAGTVFEKRRRSQGTGHLWQADHITPVAEGGGECGIENYRTLCTACHKAETTALAKRMAKARKPEP